MSMMREVKDVVGWAYFGGYKRVRCTVVFDGCGHEQVLEHAFDESVGIATFQGSIMLAVRGSVRICRECLETVAVFPEPVAGPPAPAGASPVPPGLPAGRRPL